jgi:hypothetical protein
VTSPARETPLDITVHHGGSGGSPFYVARLTEQEALGILRAELEAAGLRFGATPPELPELQGWNFWGNPEIALSLYDAERSVGVLFDTDDQSHLMRIQWGWQGMGGIAEQIAPLLAEQVDYPIGVFYNPGASVGGRPEWDGRWMDIEWEAEAPTEENKTAAVVELRQAITEQTQVFIAFLQEQGVL